MRGRSSPETLRLIELCAGWSDGRVSDAELREAVRQRAAQAQQARGAFVGAAASEQVESGRGHAVIRAFDNYLAALAAIGKCRPNAMGVAAKSLDRAGAELFWAFQGYYAQFPLEGVTPYPALNALIEAARAGQVTVDALLDAARGGDAVGDRAEEARAWVDDCLLEMQNPAPGEPSEAVARVAEGLRQCRAGVDQVAAGDVDAGQRSIEEAMRVVADGWDLYAAQKAVGPTASLVVNSLLQAAEAVGRGEYSLDLFVEGLERFELELAGRAREYLMSEAAHRDSPSVQALVAQAQDALRAQSEACAAWRRYVDDRDVRHLAIARSALLSSTSVLVEVDAALAGLGHLGKAVCSHCGAVNEISARSCVSCSATLGRFARDDAGGSSFSISEAGVVDAGNGPVMTENMRRLAEACDAVAAGEHGADEFLATLDWMEDRLARAESSQPSLPPLEDEALAATYALTRSTAALFADGIRQMRVGLAELRHYVTDGDRQHLVTGLRTAFDASQTIYQAGRVGDMIVSDLPAEDDLVEPVSTVDIQS